MNFNLGSVSGALSFSAKIKRILGIIGAAVVSLLAIGAWVGCIVVGEGGFLERFLFPIIMTVIAVVAVMSAIFTNKKAKFKNTQLGDIIREIFPNCTYEPDSFILPEEYKATEMLRMGSNYEGSDLLSGQTSTGVPFRYCEIYTYDVTHDSKGSSSKTTVFKGGLFTFDYPKHFEYKIVAAPKGITKGQGFGKAWFEGYKKVETESVEFNKAFTVYANNMEEVFYIFTPQVMERFIQLNNRYKKGIIFGLKDGKINIAVPGLNMFEPPAFGLKNPTKLEEFKNKTREQLDMFLTIEQLLRLEPQSDEAHQQQQEVQQQTNVGTQLPNSLSNTSQFNVNNSGQ